MNEANDLTFTDYQTQAAAFAMYPTEAAVVYPMLGLMGETGELCEKLLAVAAQIPDGGSLTAIMFKGALEGFTRVGKLAEAEKKRVRDQGGFGEADKAWCSKFRGLLFGMDITPISKEIGDGQMWYANKVMGDMGLNAADVAQGNLDKLTARKKTNTISGAGDTREVDAPVLPS